MYADVDTDVYADMYADVGDDVMMTSSPDPVFDPTRSMTRPGQRSRPDPVNGQDRLGQRTQQPEHALPRAATRAEPSGGA